MEVDKEYQYKVYKISPSDYYNGSSLVAAESAEEANEFIKSFKEANNDCNSLGYSFVDEDDVLDYVRSSVTGIIDYGRNYIG